MTAPPQTEWAGPPGCAVRVLDDHVDRLAAALPALRAASGTPAAWGAPALLAHRLAAGGRLLAAGNGGSAAEAQHLTAELIGRFDRDRAPCSAIALHADTSSLTAIANGYGEVYARQVRAHARPEDIVLLLSTSGRNPNLLAAAVAARRCSARCWALTGLGPNPFARPSTAAVCLPGDAATVQESHLAALHMMCRAVEAALRAGDTRRSREIS